MITESKDGIFKPKAPIVTVSKPASKPRIDYTITETPTYKIATQFPQWCSIMHEEFTALTRQRTWILVPPSPTQNVVGCKWVFKLKHNSDESISRYKVRLVAKCNTVFLPNGECTSICGNVLHFCSHIFQLLVVC